MKNGVAFWPECFGVAPRLLFLAFYTTMSCVTRTEFGTSAFGQ